MGRLRLVRSVGHLLDVLCIFFVYGLYLWLLRGADCSVNSAIVLRNLLGNGLLYVCLSCDLLCAIDIGKCGGVPVLCGGIFSSWVLAVVIPYYNWIGIGFEALVGGPVALEVA